MRIRRLAFLFLTATVAVAVETVDEGSGEEETSERLRFSSLLNSACACAPLPTTGDFPTCGCAPIRPSPRCQCTPVTTQENQCLCVSITISITVPEPTTTTTTTTTTTAAPTTTQPEPQSNQCSCLPIAGPICGCSSTLTGRDCNCAPVQHAPGGPCSCIASGSSTSSLVAELIRQLTQQLQAGGGLPLPTPSSPQQVRGNGASDLSWRGDTTGILQPAHDTPLPMVATFPPQQLQPTGARQPVLQWVETRNYMMPGGAPPPAAATQAASISAPSISTVDSSISTNGSPTVPPLLPLPCLRPVCLTECRAECPQPVARICIEACQKSCEARCPAPSMTYLAPTSTIMTTTPVPSSTSTLSSLSILLNINSSNTTTTNTPTWSTIRPVSTMTASSTASPVVPPVQSSTTPCQAQQIVVSMQVGECARRCGDRCSNECAARSLDGCDTLCKITCEVSCSLPPPARSNSSNSQSVQSQPSIAPPVPSRQPLEGRPQEGTGPFGGFTQGVQQPQQQPAAPLLFFPYTIGAQAPAASVVSAPSSSACPPACEQPSVQSPQQIPPLVQPLPVVGSNPQSTATIRLTVDTSALPLPSPRPSEGAPRCVVGACHQGCVCESVPPSSLPPSPPTPLPQIVDLGASLASLCAVVPKCSPCTPACLEQAANECAPDCVSACRVQCAAQSQPLEACSPACNAVCAATC